MNKFIYILFGVLVLSSCSEYQKALKSDDVEYKTTVFLKQVEKKKYSKATRLFEQYAASYRGKAQSENAFFNYAHALYMNKQYISAAYQFESFASSYPKSPKAEEAAFLGAECYSKTSPMYSLDQVDTEKGLNKIQAFINKYPNSTLLPKANEVVKQLTEKLELKAYEIAKQYNTIGEFTRDYNAAVKALDNFMFNYPGSKYKEDALFYKYDSMYKLAVNSVPAKKEERLNTTKVYYQNLVKFKADTKYLEKANKMLEKVDKELKQYTN
ncbi:outer membrane protein assembly factor BamD [Flavobacterium urocaniciphilum]|uniref:Beta-barrel assembly machine subunit BamD n=1 Tax=Flavobacterium urocaniciphilum TaxID=1299341 RepID=A0A1H9DA26_9FLAO|nr:outer membrane protein assembly factor BamD [Flavobacterium urocaniciphilum]SEQ10325.1 Beta-barrel assembly machine subunit BamD [Flavobacterium urocaniciphilum]